MITRLVWWAGLLALAVVALFAQLDRSARFSPGMAAFVPASFSGFAAERRAQSAVLTRDGDAALAEVRALVAARPLPAEHLSLLAQAYIHAGKNDPALAALEAASKRGWRDPVVQLAAAQAALAGGEFPVAAQRLSALFATNALPEPRNALLTQLLVTDAGRAAFAERLAGEGRWQVNLVAAGGIGIDPANLAQTLLLAEEAGATFPCDQLIAIAERAESGQPLLPPRCA